MNHIHKEPNGFSVYENSIDIKGLIKTKNIKISEIVSVDTNPLLSSLKITTRDKKTYPVAFGLREYSEATAHFLQGKIDAPEYKKTIEDFDSRKEELIEQAKKRRMKWIIGISATVIILFIIGSLDDSSSSTAKQKEVAKQETPAVPEAPSESQANVMAQGMIKQLLKSPSTADFPFLDYTTTINGNRYIVVSHVDSQNGFGAMIRSNWRLVMDHNGGEWNSPRSWDIVEIWMDGEQIL